MGHRKRIGLKKGGVRLAFHNVRQLRKEYAIKYLEQELKTLEGKLNSNPLLIDDVKFREKYVKIHKELNLIRLLRM